MLCIGLIFMCCNYLFAFLLFNLKLDDFEKMIQSIS